MKVAIAAGAVVLGLLMLAASMAAGSMFGGTSAWTAEKAARSTEVKNRLSNIGPIVNSPTPRSIHGGPDPATLKAEFDALVKENEQLNAEFLAARDNPKTASSFLKWGGISLAVIGLIGWYAAKQSE